MGRVKFKTLCDAIHVNKESGTSVDYFIFDEYEIHLNKIAAHTIQEWHYHSKISETILVTKGTLSCRYIEGGTEFVVHLEANDMVEVGSSIHTFQNNTDETAEFIVFRFVPEGVDKREFIMSDKTIVAPENQDNRRESGDIQLLGSSMQQK